jgi:hypothetical protein
LFIPVVHARPDIAGRASLSQAAAQQAIAVVQKTLLRRSFQRGKRWTIAANCIFISLY